MVPGRAPLGRAVLQLDRGIGEPVRVHRRARGEQAAALGQVTGPGDGEDRDEGVAAEPSRGPLPAAGVAAHAPHPDAAISFLEYLATPEAQAYFADQNYEYPAAADATVADVPASFGTFRSDTLNLSVLGENQPKAQAIFNEIGFP